MKIRIAIKVVKREAAAEGSPVYRVTTWRRAKRVVERLYARFEREESR